MEDGGLEELLVGIVGWSVMFALLRFFVLPNRSHDFCNRIVSLIHVAVALLLCSLSVEDWQRPFHPLASPASPLQMRAMTISLAYFIYDLFCCMLEGPFDFATCIHHLLSILGLAYGFLKTMSGTELVSCLWLMEVSNPCMHGRELLKQVGFRNTPLNLWNDVAFALTFTVARLGFGPYLTYITLRAPNPLIVKIGASGIQIVSIFWFMKIAKLVVYKLRPQTSKLK